MVEFKSAPEGAPPTRMVFMGAGNNSYNKRIYFMGVPRGTQLTRELTEHMLWHERVGPAPFGGGVSGFVQVMGELDIYEIYVYTD